MSDDNKFFRWVWRVNAVVLLLALIGGCACLAFQANAVFKWFPPSNTYTPAQLEPSGMFQPVPPKDGTAGKFELVVTEPGVVGKSQMLALVRQLARGMEGVSSGFSSQPGTQTVNILAVEPELAKAHWLFEGQNRWIVFHKAFAETGPDTALALEVIEEDTNKDGKVAPNDRHAF